MLDVSRQTWFADRVNPKCIKKDIHTSSARNVPNWSYCHIEQLSGRRRSQPILGCLELLPVSFPGAVWVRDLLDGTFEVLPAALWPVSKVPHCFVSTASPHGFCNSIAIGTTPAWRDLSFHLQPQVLCQELWACTGLDGANKAPP